MERLGHLAKQRFERHNLASSARSAEVLYAANRFLAEALYAEPSEVNARKLEKGILHIATQNAAWSHQVWGVQEALLFSLVERYGEKVVRTIRIKSLTTG